MSEERSDELTRQEQAALHALAQDVTPSPAREDAIVAALRDRGLIAPRRRGLAAIVRIPLVPRLAMAGAALGVAFFLGVQVGRNTGRAEVPGAYLETEEPQEAEQPAPAPEPGGELQVEVTPAADGTVFAAAGWDKPRLAPDDPGYDSFPAYPLDGKTHTVSTRPR